MYAVGNRMAGDDAGRCWPADVRSLSVGDLVPVTGDRAMTFLAVARFGFDEVLEPVNPIVRIEGTVATSRPALTWVRVDQAAACCGGRRRRSSAANRGEQLSLFAGRAALNPAR